MRLNLLVIKSPNPEKLKEQYEYLGFAFEHHQHGKGPLHFASENLGFVFEIYPLGLSVVAPDLSVVAPPTVSPPRLGFETTNLPSLMKTLENSTWKIIQEPKETEWGVIAVIQDLDGRKVELKSV